MPQRLGIMGGTFDPVHLGHLRTAEEAIEDLDFDSLLFIPAADPPHKGDRRIIPFAHRWNMLDLAVQGNPRFRLSDVEQKMPGKSYTVNTLKHLLQSDCRGTEMYFLVGLDAFLELHTWWHYLELFRLARMVVVRRPGYREEETGTFLKQNISSGYEWDPDNGFFLHQDLHPVYFLKNTYLDISSTRIRRLRHERRSIRYLVPDGVMHYILTKNLYS